MAVGCHGRKECRIAEKLKEKKVPVVTINIEAEDVPFLSIDAYSAGCGLMEHLIDEHGCTRINLVLDAGRDVFSGQMEKAYREVLAEKGLAFDERRVLHRQAVNRENYRECKIHYGSSCGCRNHEEAVYNRKYQDLILAKVEAATQVSSMMQYNNALEKVESLEQLADNIKSMLEGISCSGLPRSAFGMII